MKKLYLLDAFALIFRAYYALVRSPRITSAGKNTNAQFGFTNTLVEILNKEKPTHIAIAFDTKAKTERHEMFENYKSNRQETPEDILAAVPDIKTILEGFRIPIIELDGYEADDIIGTIATKCGNENCEVFMVSPDKDYGQIVSKNIFIYKPSFQKNERQILGEKEVCETWDIEKTEQVIDILGLMGDAVDNIPGVAGIGEKTASKLLKEYGSIENIILNANNIKGSVGEKIKKNIDSAILSKKLATINKEVPIEINIDSFIVKEIDKDLLKKIFTELEFKTLGKRILGEDVLPPNIKNNENTLFNNNIINEEIQNNLNSNFNNINTITHNYILINTQEELNDLKNKLLNKKIICIDTETTGLDIMTAELVGISICYEPKKAYYINLPKNKEAIIVLLNILKPVFESTQILWVGQNIKFDLGIFANYNIEFFGKFYDTMLAQYLIDAESKKSMDFLSEKYLKYSPISIETLIGPKGKKQKNMRDVEIEKIKEYAAEDADITLQLFNYFNEEKLLDNNLLNVFNNIEIPLLKVLLDMERVGVSLDTDMLKTLSIKITNEIIELEKKIFELTNSTFNLASPKQLGEILFDKLNILNDAKATKTKTGQYSTDDSVLEKLVDKHPSINHILIYRELSKLKSTYIDALPDLVNKNTNRIHTTFNQSKAVTGRLSSINPNLQNIPVRTEIGKQMRKAFIPKDNKHILMSADYSQIELRIIAALSNDENMIFAFKNKIDIHTATAAKIYKLDINDVTKEMRYKAKSVNFGIIYGQGAWGLSQNINVPQKEAKNLIESYFSEYPNIKKYIEDQIQIAKENGFVETISGRKRWLKDINSANATIRGFAERNAINMPIQGTAADMIKLAMIKIYEEMNDQKLLSKMILQVHDELLFEVHLDEKDKLKQIVEKVMPNALMLPNNVPIEIEIGFGNNWLEAH